MISAKTTSYSYSLTEKEQFLQDPHTRLQTNWDTMIQKTEKLERNARHNQYYREAAKKARVLITELITARKDFMQSSKDTLEVKKEKFRTNCLAAIDRARSELVKHRGWKQILADLTINLLIFVGTGSLSMVFTGKFRFFTPQTDSAKKLSALEKSVQGIIHIPPRSRC